MAFVCICLSMESMGITCRQPRSQISGEMERKFPRFPEMTCCLSTRHLDVKLQKQPKIHALVYLGHCNMILWFREFRCIAKSAKAVPPFGAKVGTDICPRRLFDPYGEQLSENVAQETEKKKSNSKYFFMISCQMEVIGFIFPQISSLHKSIVY